MAISRHYTWPLRDLSQHSLHRQPKQHMMGPKKSEAQYEFLKRILNASREGRVTLLEQQLPSSKHTLPCTLPRRDIHISQNQDNLICPELLWPGPKRIFQ